MKSQILSSLKLILFLVIGIFFFWLAFRGQDFNAIKIRWQKQITGGYYLLYFLPW